MSYLVLDIETVPDFSAWQPPESEPEIPRLKEEKAPSKADVAFLDLAIARLEAGKPLHPDDAEKAHDIAVRLERQDDSDRLAPLFVVEQKKDVIPPPHAHRPISIGCLWLASDFTTKRLGCISVAKHGDDERKLLSEWAEFMTKERPCLVTWNGRSFDLPVLALRSYKWGVPLKWYDKDYRYRYSDDKHMDLMDAMTEFGAANRLGFKLDVISKMLGLPGKYGFDGSMVKSAYEAGKIEEIDTYCMTDIIQTAFVLMRWMIVRGRATTDSYRIGVESLLDACGKQQRFEEFLKLIDKRQLLLGD